MSSLEELQQLIHRKYGIEPSQLDPDQPMLEAGIDSLALVEFLFEVEEKFKVSLDAYPDIQTLSALAQAIDEVRARAAQTA